MLITAALLLGQMGTNPELAGAASDAIDGAISRAQVLLETQLRTSFAPLTVTDRFIIEPTTPCRLKGMVRLRLSNGCLRGPVVVSQSTQLNGPYDAVAAEDVLVDEKKGLVQVDQEVLVERFVKVSYTSGFTSEDTPPEELLQAMFAMTPLLLLSTDSATSGESTPPKNATRYKSLYAVGEDMSFPYHRRSLGGVADPVHSTVIVSEEPAP